MNHKKDATLLFIELKGCVPFFSPTDTLATVGLETEYD